MTIQGPFMQLHCHWLNHDQDPCLFCPWNVGYRKQQTLEPSNLSGAFFQCRESQGIASSMTLNSQNDSIHQYLFISVTISRSHFLIHPHYQDVSTNFPSLIYSNETSLFITFAWHQCPLAAYNKSKMEVRATTKGVCNYYHWNKKVTTFQ